MRAGSEREVHGPHCVSDAGATSLLPASMPQRRHRAHSQQSGFAITAELMLVVVLLGIGLVTGWVKLRDQGLSEIRDSVNGMDAYLLGAQPLWNTGGTRWLKAGAVVEPAVAGAVTERWVDDTGSSRTFSTVTETAPGVYRGASGVLVYGPDNADEGR